MKLIIHILKWLSMGPVVLIFFPLYVTAMYFAFLFKPKLYDENGLDWGHKTFKDIWH